MTQAIDKEKYAQIKLQLKSRGYSISSFAKAIDRSPATVRTVMRGAVGSRYIEENLRAVCYGLPMQ